MYYATPTILDGRIARVTDPLLWFGLALAALAVALRRFRSGASRALLGIGLVGAFVAGCAVTPYGREDSFGTITVGPPDDRAAVTSSVQCRWVGWFTMGVESILMDVPLADLADFAGLRRSDYDPTAHVLWIIPPIDGTIGLLGTDSATGPALQVRGLGTDAEAREAGYPFPTKLLSVELEDLGDNRSAGTAILASEGLVFRWSCDLGRPW